MFPAASDSIRQPSEDRQRPGFRSDIQGLRAVAVMTVLLFHIEMPFMSGGYVGVDVFFVISGFLITGILLRESARSGRISLLDFYAHRVRRIIPAATLVLVFVTIATAALVRVGQWKEAATEISASAAYIVNWYLAFHSTFVHGHGPGSPVQHFWSLAVEEQFYIIWPVLLVGALALARARTEGIDRRRIAIFSGVAVLVVTISSLLCSVLLTARHPMLAFFVTPTRMWELGLGATIAVFASTLAKLPPLAALLAGWLGLGAILTASVCYTVDTPMPGYHALVPTLGATAIIVSGMNSYRRYSVAQLLSVAPMQWTGNLSYSLYLWHWPLLAFAAYGLDRELELWQAIAIAMLSFLPSWVSYRFVETPLRYTAFLRRSRTAIYFGVALMVISVVSAGVLYLSAR